MAVKICSHIDEETFAPPNGNSNGLLGPCVSRAMQSIAATIRDLASTDIPVLILGETGTGKEVVALAIHQLSERANAPFLKVRCASLKPEEFHMRLGGSELGARSCASGTVLLDEISDLSPECQALLLECFCRPGEGPERFQLGGCVISTSSKSTQELFEACRFRRDLYYRLSGVCLTLPPLRERIEDTVPLAQFFAVKYADLYGRPRPRIGPALAERLNEHAWPGNVRELENTIKRVVALGNDSHVLKELGESATRRPTPVFNQEGRSLKEAARAASRQAERELILKVLSRTRWNRKRAAEELQISYKALLYKLKQIGLEEPVS